MSASAMLILSGLSIRSSYFVMFWKTVLWLLKQCGDFVEHFCDVDAGHVMLPLFIDLVWDVANGIRDVGLKLPCVRALSGIVALWHINVRVELLDREDYFRVVRVDLPLAFQPVNAASCRPLSP